MIDIPEGFEKHDRSTPLTDPWEPIWKRHGPESVQLGLRVAEAHCNGRGFAHGGLIASLADNAMGLSLGVTSGLLNLVTVHLSIDYVRSVQRGQWLQVEPRIVRVGKSLGFVDALITADAEIAARANAVFMVVS
jgi:uncharacterized protein (TIGR00369 family)